MTIEEKTVLGVEDGWVLFGNTAGGPLEFRRTTETCVSVTGKKAVAGDVVRFKVHKRSDGTADCYYVEGGDAR